MKINWGIIKFLVITSFVIFLFGFSKQRNESRKLTKIELDFKEESRFFITQDSVNKLLILNRDTLTSIGKETLVLNKLENRLLNNALIKNAEVYISIDGVLGAKIEQREPIARVVGSPDFYLDEEGVKMPLSTIYSARVPIVKGEKIEDTTDFSQLTKLLLKINEDDFMKEYVVGLDLVSNGDIELRIRKNNFKVLFGKSINIDEKFKKFKAFYKYTKQDSLLSEYNLVNLKFNNQVVATKR